MDALLSTDSLAALLALIAMEIVLGVDNLIFISLLVAGLPNKYQNKARYIGIGFALVARIAMLYCITWLVSLTQPIINFGIQGPIGPDGKPSFDTAFSWRDIILISGGLFLIWKTTLEMHKHINPDDSPPSRQLGATTTLGMAVVQIVVLDMVFSIDSILTAVGMTDQLAIMIIAVIIAMGIMVLASKVVVDFISENPTMVMLALGFLLMIGVVLVAEGFGHHIQRGYIYFAILFSCFVEFLNTRMRKNKKRNRS